MPLPSHRDPEALRAALEAWLRPRLGSDAVVGPVSIPAGTGMSSETLLFDVTVGGTTESLVARLQPDMNDWPVFPVYDLPKQAAAMQIAGKHCGLPVPEVRFIEPNPAELGMPFIVMSRVGGRALQDMMPYTFGGTFLDSYSAAERAELQREFMGVLARLHALDLGGVDVSAIGPVGGDALGRQLDAQRAYFDWARGTLEVPIIDRALDALEKNRPPDPGPTVLNWGDARPGNLLMEGTTPTALLDWEMVDLGPAGVDVGWAIFMHAFFQHLAGVFEVPGFPDLFEPTSALADYRAAGGRDIADLDWYVLYGSVRMAIVSLRTSGRDVAHGNRPEPDNPEDLIMHRAMLEEQLAKL